MGQADSPGGFSPSLNPTPPASADSAARGELHSLLLTLGLPQADVEEILNEAGAGVDRGFISLLKEAVAEAETAGADATAVGEEPLYSRVTDDSYTVGPVQASLWSSLLGSGGLLSGGGARGSGGGGSGGGSRGRGGGSDSWGEGEGWDGTQQYLSLALALSLALPPDCVLRTIRKLVQSLLHAVCPTAALPGITTPVLHPGLCALAPLQPARCSDALSALPATDDRLSQLSVLTHHPLQRAVDVFDGFKHDLACAAAVALPPNQQQRLQGMLNGFATELQFDLPQAASWLRGRGWGWTESSVPPLPGSPLDACLQVN